MKRTAALLLAGITALGGSACSSDQPDAKQSAGTAQALPSTSAPKSSAASSSASRTNGNGVGLNDRGDIVKALGENGGLSDPVDESAPWALTFAVDSITVDPECTTNFAEPPSNGHYLAVNVRATTSPGLPADWYIQFTSDAFKVVGPDGITKDSLNGNSYSCLPEGDLFTYDTLGPGQQYAGTVVLDSPVDSGSLIFTIPGGEGGWEWSF
jgi:hypothetical protein